MENILKNAVYLSVILFLLMSISSCQKDKEELPPVNPPEQGIIAVCEGNFNWGNASISSYDESNDLLINNYFEQVNDFSLGDIAQSITETEDYYLIVVNNSGKIEIVDKKDFASIASITGLGSPRYCQLINDSLAYVSNLSDNEIKIINFTNGDIEGQIPLMGWSEQMVKSVDSVYVTRYNSHSIAILNSLTHEFHAEINIDLSPTSIEIDNNGMLWVLGSEFGGISKLYKINSATREIENEWVFEAGNDLVQIDIPNNATSIYLATSNGDIFKHSILASSLIEPIFSIDADGLYGLNVNDKGEIYVCEAYDFVQQGSISKYSENGVLDYSIQSGINPNAVVFR